MRILLMIPPSTRRHSDARAKGDYVAVLLRGSLLNLSRNTTRAYGLVDGQETCQLVGQGCFLDLVNGEALEEEDLAPKDLLLQ
jgi:hypothetical protein